MKYFTNSLANSFHFKNIQAVQPRGRTSAVLTVYYSRISVNFWFKSSLFLLKFKIKREAISLLMVVINCIRKVALQ